MATANGGSKKTAFLSTLRTELENVDDGAAEHLAAHLLSKMLDGIGIYVAKAGSQFGGDAGTTGLRRREIRVESKRYKQSTSLSPRMLAGEIVEASHADPNLEVWILVATKAVSETERRLARYEAERRGFPMVVIDWTEPAAGAGIPSLAALCARWPKVVETHVNGVAADAARGLRLTLVQLSTSLAPVSRCGISVLKACARRLQPTCKARGSIVRRPRRR